MASFEDYLFIKNTKWVFWGLGAVLLAALIFHAGVAVGSHRPMRYRGAGDDFRPPFMAGMTMPEGFIHGGYGATGTIESVSSSTITIQTRDGAQEQVEVGSTTVVSGATVDSPASLMPGEFVIIIGDPSDIDDGIVDARFIRVLPPPPQNSSTTPVR